MTETSASAFNNGQNPVPSTGTLFITKISFDRHFKDQILETTIPKTLTAVQSKLFQHYYFNMTLKLYRLINIFNIILFAFSEINFWNNRLKNLMYIYEVPIFTILTKFLRFFY